MIKNEMIKKMTHATLSDYNKPNEGFLVTGRIIPKYADDRWTYTEEVFSEPYIKQYEHEDIDPSYMEDDGKIVFLYYAEDVCIGQVRLCAHWNGYALVEDIAVSGSWRGKGIGRKLLDRP